MRRNILFVMLMVLVSSLSYGQEQALHLNLKEVLQLAQANNASVLVSHERVLQSLANISSAQSALLPQITGSFGGKRQTVDLRAGGIPLPSDPHVGPFNSFDTRGRLTMAIFDAESSNRLKAARAGKKLSLAQQQKVKEDILALVADMYLEAKRAHQAIALTKVTFDLAEFRLKVIQAQFQQGLSSALNVQEAKAQLSDASYIYETAKYRANQTRMDLASAVNLPLDQLIIFDDDMNLPNKELKEAPLSADVAVGEAQLEQSQMEASQIKGSLMPKIVASGDLGKSGKSIDESSRTYGLGINVSVPIWEGGLKSAQLKNAKSRIKENEILLEDTKRKHEINLSLAVDGLNKAKAYLAAKQQAYVVAQEQLAVSQNRLQSGLGHVLELNQAQAQEALALDDHHEAEAIYWTAKINLAHQMGAIEQLFK